MVFSKREATGTKSIPSSDNALRASVNRGGRVLDVARLCPDLTSVLYKQEWNDFEQPKRSDERKCIKGTTIRSF